MPLIRHDEIVEKFLSSKAVDFNALGKFVADMGPSIAASGRGDYGVRFGHYNILACFWIGPIDRQLEQFGGRAAGIASEVTGGH